MGKELAACLNASNPALAFVWLPWERAGMRSEILVSENMESVWYLYVQGPHFELIFFIEILHFWQKWDRTGSACGTQLCIGTTLTCEQSVVVITGWRNAEVWRVTDTPADHGLVGSTMSSLLVVRVLMLLAWCGKPWVYGGLLRVAEGTSALQVTGMIGLCFLVWLYADLSSSARILRCLIVYFSPRAWRMTMSRDGPWDGFTDLLHLKVWPLDIISCGNLVAKDL